MVGWDILIWRAEIKPGNSCVGITMSLRGVPESSVPDTVTRPFLAIVKSPLTCDPVSRIAILKGRPDQAWRLIKRMIVNLNVCLFEPIQAI